MTDTLTREAATATATEKELERIAGWTADLPADPRRLDVYCVGEVELTDGTLLRGFGQRPHDAVYAACYHAGILTDGTPHGLAVGIDWPDHPEADKWSATSGTVAVYPAADPVAVAYTGMWSRVADVNGYELADAAAGDGLLRRQLLAEITEPDSGVPDVALTAAPAAEYWRDLAVDEATRIRSVGRLPG